jgi:hypothetical protein
MATRISWDSAPVRGRWSRLIRSARAVDLALEGRDLYEPSFMLKEDVSMEGIFVRARHTILDHVYQR